MSDPKGQHPTAPPLGSLLDGIPSAPVVVPARPRAQDQLRTIVGRIRRDPDLKWVRRIGAVTLGAVLLVVGAMGVRSLLPRPVPDYLDDSMDEVLDFTLLSDDFNKLPVERRLELIKDLIERMKTMSASDSAVMAAFAASIKDEMRRQLETNARKLAVDVLDTYARDYTNVPPEQQGDYLDQSIIGFTRMMEDISGEKSGLPEDDAERLSAIKNQARRDQERMKENDRPLSPGRAARLFEFVHNDEETVSNPVQRGQMARFMRDMTRHLRGQDPTTGKPLPPG